MQPVMLSVEQKELEHDSRLRKRGTREPNVEAQSSTIHFLATDIRKYRTQEIDRQSAIHDTVPTHSCVTPNEHSQHLPRDSAAPLQGARLPSRAPPHRCREPVHLHHIAQAQPENARPHPSSPYLTPITININHTSTSNSQARRAISQLGTNKMDWRGRDLDLEEASFRLYEA